MILPLVETIKERVETFFLGTANLIEDAPAGSKKLRVDNTAIFNEESLLAERHFSHVNIWSDSGDGSPIESGFDGVEIKKVKSINPNDIFLTEALTNSWTVADNTQVTRAPNGVSVKNVFIGDVSVVRQFPTICIIPSSKNVTWATLSGTMEKMTINFIIYVQDDNTSESNLELYRLTDALEYHLMSCLRLPMNDAQFSFEKTSKATVTNIQYGTIDKGSTFLKAANITFEADVYFWRTYITAQGNISLQLPLGQNYNT